MAYTDSPPTLDELASALALDLRDPNSKTFTAADLTRFLNDGQVEINRVYPLVVTDAIPVVQDQQSYDTRFTRAYRVEIWGDSAFYTVLPFNDGDSVYGGWELQGTTLYIPPSVCGETFLAAFDAVELRVTGYARRQALDVNNPNDPTELDSEAAMAVRWFAQYRAFASLMADRSLFAEWQSQSNNTDVSMPMLLNLVATANQQWERERSHLRTLRLSPPGNPVLI